MSEEEKRSLLCYRQYIVERLNPAYVVSYMKDWLSNETVEKIQSHKEMPTFAAGLFLDSIVNLTKDGWFRGFLDALDTAGYTGLREAIENWDFGKIQKLEVHRELLHRILPSLREIDVAQILLHMNKCLIHEEFEEIQQVKRNEGNAAGIRKLVECLCRSDKENWPKTFQLALEQTGCDEQSELWNLNEGCVDNTCVEMRDVDEGACAVDINIQFYEEAEPDNFSASPGSSSLGACFRSVYVPKEARSYQTELARPALSGKHTIICAPTGSGKTFVSIMICEHHLRNMPPGRKGKVVFLTTKVPVYEQQKKVFEEYFKGKYGLKSTYVVVEPS